MSEYNDPEQMRRLVELAEAWRRANINEYKLRGLKFVYPDGRTSVIDLRMLLFDDPAAELYIEMEAEGGPFLIRDAQDDRILWKLVPVQPWREDSDV